MGWVQPLVAGLVMITIALGIRSRLPLDYGFSSQQQQVQGEEGEEIGCFPALFSFGSSVADTGTQATAMPFGAASVPPYGVTFFGGGSRRFSDGRLHIDFWASALKLPFLDPYLQSVGSNFRRGVNFAAAGATAANGSTFSPFSLSVQVNQFREFKHDVLALRHRGQGSPLPSKDSETNKLPLEESFRDALYVIAIGGNDFVRWFIPQGLSPQEVEIRAGEVSEAILWAVKALYAEGARNILVEDVFPQGCLPLFLEKFAGQYSDQLDDVGCLKPFNAIVQLHNSLLKKGIAELGRQLPDASIAVIDTYSRRYDIIVNHEQYGFKVPLKSCCGMGGDYNFKPFSTCGTSTVIDGQLVTVGMCDDVSTYVVWDGIHFTEAFNRIVMKTILSGRQFEPEFDLLRNGCTLSEI